MRSDAARRIRRALGAALFLAPAACEPSAAPRDRLFADVATQVGIQFTHENGARGKYYLPEIMGPGCALFDYDLDGDLDVYAVQSGALDDALPGDAPRGEPRPTSRLFRNDLVGPGAVRGSLHFTDVTEAARVGAKGYGLGCAVGDYDNDGDPDLYVTCFGPNVLFENGGDGAFTDVTAAAGVGDPGFSVSAAFLDYDLDGRLDLFVANYVEFQLGAHRACARLGGQPDYCGPLSYAPAPDRLYHNEGGGRFADATSRAGLATRYFNGLGAVAADLDGDGWPDIFVANDATPNQLWMNQRDGRFRDEAVERGCAYGQDGVSLAGMGVAAADFDRDGDLDLYITHEVTEVNTLYRNRGDGRFEDASAASGLATPSLPYSGFGTAFLDVDADGWLDLFVANGAVRKLADQLDTRHPYRQPDQLFHNAGGKFTEVTASAGLEDDGVEAGRGAAIGDVDGDAAPDLLVANNAGPLRLLLNRAGTSSRTISVEFRGRSANRGAVGARVLVRVPGGQAWAHSVGTEGSYASASSPILLVPVPLGVNEVELEVKWPCLPPVTSTVKLSLAERRVVIDQP